MEVVQPVPPRRAHQPRYRRAQRACTYGARSVLKTPQMWRFVLSGSLWLFLLMFRAGSALAATPEISRLDAISANGKISVRVAVRNAFELAEISRSLQSGLPTGFSYQFELVRKRPNWFDDTLATSTVEVIATWNSVTREYLVNYRRDGKLVRSETVTGVAELREKMTQVDEPALFDRNNRPPFKLVVRARVDISRKVVFYIIPSVSSTEWRQTRVRSAPPGRVQR